MPSCCIERTIGRASLMSAPVARTALTMNSNGDFTLARYASAERNSGDVRIVVITARRSPCVSRKVSVARSTSGCGGVSLTNRRTSVVEMNRAVAGQLRQERDAAALRGVRDPQASERTRDYRDVLLCVVAVNAKRMQLEQL